MGKQCYLCGKNTIFFIWSTSRAFPIHKLKPTKKEKAMYSIGVPICFRCFERIKEEAYGGKHQETSTGNTRSKNK